MEEVDRFIKILGQVESSDDPEAWGDSGRAAGRFQQHPSFYASWGPAPQDFRCQERTWDWAFEFAARRFFRIARATVPAKPMLAIAMALHLHGQVRWDGNDAVYAAKWQQYAKAVDGTETA
jgi:hypothetical protein